MRLPFTLLTLLSVPATIVLALTDQALPLPLSTDNNLHHLRLSPPAPPPPPQPHNLPPHPLPHTNLQPRTPHPAWEPSGPGGWGGFNPDGDIHSHPSDTPHPPPPREQAGGFGGIKSNGAMFVKKPGKEEEVFKVASSDDEGFMMRRRRRKVVRRKKGDLRGRGRGRKGVGNDDEAAGPSNAKERKMLEKTEKMFMKPGPHWLQVPDGPEPRRLVFGDPPRSRWPPRKSRKRPEPVGGGKNFPGKANRLIEPPESKHSSDHQIGYYSTSTSSSSSDMPPRMPRRKRPVNGARRKLLSGEREKKFPGKGYRLGDGTPEPAPTSPPAPRPTQEKWVPPSETPSLAPPKRRFPSVGLPKGIRKLFPGRKAKDKKADPDTAGPSSPLDQLDQLDPEVEAEMAEEARNAGARNKPLFPGKPRKLEEPSPPPSPRASGSPRAAPGSPAGSHHSTPVESDGDSLSEAHQAFQRDIHRFPGVHRKIGRTEEEDAEAAERRAQGVWMTGDPMFASEASPSEPRSEGHSTSSEEDYQAWLKEKKKAEKRKWPGKAYKLQPPPEQPPPEQPASSSVGQGGKGLGLGRFLRKGSALRKPQEKPGPQPSESGSGSDSDSGESSDSSRTSSQKFPGTGYKLIDDA